MHHPLTALTWLSITMTGMLHAAEVMNPDGILPDDPRMTDGAAVRRDGLLRSYLTHPPAPAARAPLWDYTNFALAAYWFKERTAEADRAMITACDPALVRVRGNDNFPHSPEMYYRSVFFIERVFFLFHGRSRYFPGRMSREAETAVKEMLWKWAATACRKELFREDRVWWQPGTENIGALEYSGLWGATQIIAGDPDYQNRSYADGTPVPEMAKAFNDYYKRFLRERAGKGLLVEVASSYNNGTLNGWYNISDFAPDPQLRDRMRMFLDLYWADWAIEQIDGVRGGSRHRCYPGADSTRGPGGGGGGPSWYLFGVGKQVGLTAGFPVIVTAATTFYRPAPMVAAMVKEGVAGRGTYAYVSRRPGLGTSFSGRGDGGLPLVSAHDSFFAGQGGHILEPDGGGLLRYTWCTPDFVMGTSMVPALKREAWTLISSQNHWDGVIFTGHPTARIFVQPSGHQFNANWSVQNKGLMIVQQLNDTHAKDQRVWFDNSLQRVKHDGWVFAEAPQAYAAVRVVEGPTSWLTDEPQTADHDTARAAKARVGRQATGGSGIYLMCGKPSSPVILAVARKVDCKDFATFQTTILGNALKWENQRLDYTSALDHTTLTLFADYSQAPQVDGVPVNYRPAKCYDSPFIQGDFGSGVVTLRHGDAKLVMDFN